MTATTWEEAARQAANELPDDPVPLMFAGTLLDEVEHYLDRLRTLHSINDFYWIADDALQALEQTGISYESREELLDVVVRTIISKQHDYGHQNILWGGLEGIVLRMHDKTARIRNLQERGAGIRAESFVPLNESLADSWLDLVGYALIGIMLLNGSFELPLARDLEATRVGTSEPELRNAFLEAAADARDGFEDVEPPDEDASEQGSPALGSVTADPDAYDELHDPTLWHMETNSQHVFVAAWRSGFFDGEPRCGIFARGKNEKRAATGAYFRPDELGELIAYLTEVSYALTPSEAVVVA